MPVVSVSDAAAERIGGPESRADATVTHVDADACASRLGISKRHWIRLVDSGRAPQPARLGRLVRWSLATLQIWEAGGCKPVRTPSSKGGRNHG